MAVRFSPSLNCGVSLMRPYEVVEAFESLVADYCGAEFGVAVNSCTSALMLSAALRYTQFNHKPVALLPERTYVGVPQAIASAGGSFAFADMPWVGAYGIDPLGIIDSARRFRRGMYEGGLRCLSFHWGKHLKIGRGGMILTDDRNEALALRRMRYDGRTPGVHPKDDAPFVTPAWHVYMIPEDAARGLMLMESMGDDNEDIPADDYPKLDVSMFGEVSI